MNIFPPLTCFKTKQVFLVEIIILADQLSSGKQRTNSVPDISDIQTKTIKTVLMEI